MKKILLVSLIHNRKHLIGKAIQSAVNQTLGTNNWHYLLIDNASSDGADKVAEVFANKYDHISFVRMNSNIGQMPAYNWVLNEWIPQNMPSAQIMAQLDSDDMLAPIALKAVLDMFEKNIDIGMTYSNFDIIDKNDKAKHKKHPKAKLAPNQFSKEGQRILRNMQIKGNVIGHMRALSVKHLLDIGGFDESFKYSTDFNMACKMLEKHTVVKIDGPSLYLWREHGDQVQGHSSPEQTQHWKDLQKHYLDRWKNLGIL